MIAEIKDAWQGMIAEIKKRVQKVTYKQYTE